jgi:hypothetical protein
LAQIAATLKRALKQLHTERRRIDRQVTVLEDAIASLGGAVARRGRAARKAAGKAAGRVVTKARRVRRKMSAAQKQAVSQRMKVYWAKRRKNAGK